VTDAVTRHHRLPDETVMAYTEAGQGPPVVLLHGVLASRRFFERNIGPLAEHFHVIALDLRGHGGL
jgi:non-heme chloroperoxidase